MFESIARNILAKCGKKEASESVLSDQPYHKDSEQLFFSEQTDAISAALVDERYSYVNLAASHRLPTDFQNELVFALGEILKSDVFCKETLGSRAYEPRVWEVNPPPLSPRSLRQ